MSIKICRVCLRTDKTLRELKKSLGDYLQDICNYTISLSECLCCSICEKSLKSYLDFRNKCLKSNQILHDWSTNKNKNKPDIKTLHKLLLKSLKTKTEEVTTGTSKKKQVNNINVDVIKDVTIKNEMPIEIVDCGTDLPDHDVKIANEYDEKTANENYADNKNDHEKIANESHDEKVVNDNYVEKFDRDNDDKFASANGGFVINGDIFMNNELDNENNCNVGDADNSDEDDKFLIDCVKKEDVEIMKKGAKSTPKRKGKTKEKTKPYSRLYTRKGLSEYSEYATVFDIQLFNTDEEARREVAQRRLSEPYLSAQHRCTHCYTVYKCERLLQFHMKWHDPSSEFSCDICEMRFVTRKMVLNHKVKCHRGRFSCKLCPMVTYYGGAMKSHFEKHQGKTYKCHCERVFNHISSYLSHKRTTHTSEHVCVTCARTFVSALGLHTHAQKTHQGQCIDASVAVRCEACDLTFASQQVYTVHVLNTDKHRDIADTLIACQYCGLPFEDNTQLKKHKRRVHPKKKDTNDIIKCKQCGASGEGRHWRWRHYATEHPHVAYHTVTDAKTHLCHHCGKRFTNITLMKDHLNWHSGVKPHCCARCPARFHSASQLARHADSHAPPARACRLCTAAFRSASNLAAHMRIHTGIRRYTCDICSKSFLHAAALSGHVLGVHRHIRRARGKRDSTQQRSTDT